MSTALSVMAFLLAVWALQDQNQMIREIRGYRKDQEAILQEIDKINTRPAPAYSLSEHGE